MKVLVIHNSHRSGSSSGDDNVFKREKALLARYGHKVITFNPSNDEFDRGNIIKKATIAIQIPWSVSSYRKIKKIVSKENPDIVHVHTFFPLLSPSIYYAIQSSGVPLIQTLHDFRLLCPMAFFMRDGKICEVCRDGSFFRAVKYGCFKNSRLQSIPVALMLKLHSILGTFNKKVDMYICLTKSQQGVFEKAGFDKDKLLLKPNFVEDTFKQRSDSIGAYVMFLGRLGQEKGVGTLIEAWKYLPEVPLKILGNGPDSDLFKAKVDGLKIKNVQFLGFKPHEECMRALSGARFLVVPSICYEGFAVTIAEAFSHSKPVIASNIGAMADNVIEGKTGLLFKTGDAKDLSEKICWLWNNPQISIKMGQIARKEYEEKYTAKRNYELLMQIYRFTIAKHRRSHKK